jgi:hypothetical protein
MTANDRGPRGMTGVSGQVSARVLLDKEKILVSCRSGAAPLDAWAEQQLRRASTRQQ